MLSAHAAAMTAALAGWFVCALFASVAYNWTFYYLLALAAAPREYPRDRLARPRSAAARRQAAPRDAGGARMSAVVSTPARRRARSTRAISRRSRAAADSRRRAHAGELHDGRARSYRAMAGGSAGPVLLHRQRRARTGSRTSIARRPDVRLIAPAAAQRSSGSTPTSRPTSCGRRCRAARAASRCSTASAASTASTRPTASMRDWHRLFFVNERRLRNFIAAGAIDADSPAIRLSACPRSTAWSTAPSSATHVLAVARPRSRAADGALRADVVARLVAERDRRRARRSGSAGCRST